MVDYRALPDITSGPEVRLRLSPRWLDDADHVITRFGPPSSHLHFLMGQCKHQSFVERGTSIVKVWKKKTWLFFFKLRPFGYLPAHCSALCGVRQHDGNSVVLQVFQPRFIRLNKPAPPSGFSMWLRYNVHMANDLGNPLGVAGLPPVRQNTKRKPYGLNFRLIIKKKVLQ